MRINGERRGREGMEGKGKEGKGRGLSTKPESTSMLGGPDERKSEIRRLKEVVFETG